MFPGVAEWGADYDFHVGEVERNPLSARWLPAFSDGEPIPARGDLLMRELEPGKCQGNPEVRSPVLNLLSLPNVPGEVAGGGLEKVDWLFPFPGHPISSDSGISPTSFLPFLFRFSIFPSRSGLVSGFIMWHGRVKVFRDHIFWL
jgi:hypothetical protein